MFARVVGSVALVFALGTIAPPLGASAQGAPGCQYILGFKALHDLDPADIGDCADNQAFAANGDAQQHTTKGLMAWRKLDNWTAFTNGYQTWINGPQGLAKRLNTARFPWEGDAGAAPSPGAPGWCCVDARKVVLTLEDLPRGWSVYADEVSNGKFFRAFRGPDSPTEELFVAFHPSATPALAHSEIVARLAYLAHPAAGAAFPPPCQDCGTVGDESIILGPDGDVSVEWRRANYVVTILGSSADSVATTVAYGRIMDARLVAQIAAGPVS